jgi:nickel/cobalt transporter (NicO) family protein
VSLSQRWRALLRIGAACCVLMLCLLEAHASSTAQSIDQPERLALSGEVAQSKADAATPGLGSRIVAFVWAQQQVFHRRLADAFRTFREQRTGTAAWLLISIAFLYGVFHAAGPGHGKAVMTTYLLAHEHDVRRGLILSTMAALLQGVTAIVVVQTMTALLGLASGDARDAAGYLETLSFALTAGLGVMLVVRSARRLWQTVRAPARDSHGAHCGHEAHGHHCHHVVAPAVFGAGERRAALGVILSVGLRPCTGALLVLTLANAFAMQLTGIAAVLAMSVGTAATVAVLATMALMSRRLALAVVRTRGTAVSVAGHGLAVLGGLLILVLGAALLAGSLGGSSGSPLM